MNTSKRFWLAGLAALLTVAALMLGGELLRPGPARAAPAARPLLATLTVTNANDSGAGSLRQAIADAAAGDTIVFDPGLSGQTITLTSGQLVIDKNLTLDGSALAAQITVSGNNASRVFYVNAGVTCTLQSLTVANGSAVDVSGGGIYNAGTLNVTDSTLSGNTAYEAGGIYNAGTLNVTNSTLSGNDALAGGGISNRGTLNVTNSTLSGNYASNGGGIYNAGTLDVTNSTLSGNIASDGGGIAHYGGNATLRNTIVANSPSGGNCDGAITNGGNNLDDGDTCGFGAANGSLSNTAPQLGALTGSPAYFPLNSGSPAIDGVTYNAPNGAPATNQRGVSRPQGAGYDIGAYEYQAAAPSPDDFVITVKTDNAGTSGPMQFTIPTNGGGYNYNVDCDNDGVNEATGADRQLHL